jgi:hypothetical protein
MKTITTKEAERFARWCDTDGFTERAAALRSLAAERDALRAEVERPESGVSYEAFVSAMQIVTTERDARAADALKWRDAINDALTNWLSPIEDHEAPADALQRLIRLEINAALDPAVLQSAAER